MNTDGYIPNDPMTDDELDASFCRAFRPFVPDAEWKSEYGVQLGYFPDTKPAGRVARLSLREYDEAKFRLRASGVEYVTAWEMLSIAFGWAEGCPSNPILIECYYALVGLFDERDPRSDSVVTVTGMSNRCVIERRVDLGGGATITERWDRVWSENDLRAAESQLKGTT